jgi:hypothetical protein
MLPQSTSTNSSNSQFSTQNPQSLATGGISNISNSNVQSSDTASLFNGGSGISLKQTSLPVVSLGTSSSQTNSQPVVTAKHHFDAAWLILPILLVVIAVVVFWRIQVAANNTTD